MSPENAIAVLNQQDLEKACKALAQSQPVFKAVIKRHGVPSLRQAPVGLEALLQMVTEQFLSLSAAAAIWTRIKTRLVTVDAQAVLNCSLEDLMALGLSRAKAKSFQGIAGAVDSGTFRFDDLHRANDAMARQALMALPGIGPWTADIYLLSSMLRPDAWPWGDVALQAAAQHLFNLQGRPGKAEMQELGEKFRPHRAIAARLLWAHYRELKKIPQLEQAVTPPSQS